jgi:hypothetical protein
MTELIQTCSKPTTANVTLIRELAIEAYPVAAPCANWLVHEGQDGWPLVAHRQFILATRDTGYRSTSAAVSELIDNALQAGADVVHVLVREDRLDTQTAHVPNRRIALAVIDNGSGMNAAALRTALQFGGSERFNDRSGAGRFGMGLPNSSVSQSPRLELYSWRDGQSPLYSYLDVCEIARGTMCEVPAPVRRQLPEWVRAAIDTVGHRVANSGTLVLWPECDRLQYRKASTVRAKLHDVLGRTYRYALRGKIRLLVDGHPVAPVDPLMEWGSVAEKYGAATQYSDELSYEFKVPAAPTRTSIVRVRFTVLPVRRWARLPVEARRELGIIGGGGVSIVRAGREVDYGWYLMGAKRRENYDDWWRCEVRFEPALDEYFGVTHSKQGVTPHPALQDALAADLEQIARTLNLRIRSEFLRLAATGGARPNGEQQDLPNVLPVADDAAARVARERERFLPPAEQRIRRFRIAHAPLASARFFVAALERGELVVTLNSEHPMYAAASRADAGSRELFDTVLLAAARAEVMVRAGGHAPSRIGRSAAGTADALEHFAEAWSDTLAAYLGRRA